MIYTNILYLNTYLCELTSDPIIHWMVYYANINTDVGELMPEFIYACPVKLNRRVIINSVSDST